MVDRPPAKLGARLPEGSLNGLGAEIPRLLADADAEPTGYILAKYVSPKIEINRETGVRTAVIRITEVEPLLDAKMPTDYDHAGEALQALRGNRLGVMQLPEDDDRGWARLATLRRMLNDYRDDTGMSETTLGARVIDTVPGAAAGWRDDPRIIEEFLRTVLDDFDAEYDTAADPADQRTDDEPVREDLGPDIALGDGEGPVGPRFSG